MFFDDIDTFFEQYDDALIEAHQKFNEVGCFPPIDFYVDTVLKRAMVINSRIENPFMTGVIMERVSELKRRMQREVVEIEFRKKDGSITNLGEKYGNKEGH